MGFMDFLFGGSPEVTLPPAVKAEIAQLQYIPFGPERDALIDRLTTTYGLSSDLYDAELGSLGGYLTKSEDIMQGSVDQMQGISGAMQRFAGADPYMEFYGNPAAREASYLKAMEERNRAAFDPYGSVGSESEQRQGLIAADAARRGISNSGIASRQKEQEMQRYAALKAQADAEAVQGARQQGLGEAAAYSQAKQLASTNLGQAGDIQRAIATVGSQIPQNRMAAIDKYGNAVNTSAGFIGGAQSEERAAQQSVENYNTEVANKVNQDYAAATNNRNVNQANLDSSRRKPGLMDIIGPLAQTALSAYGAFGGPGAGAAGAAGNAIGSATRGMTRQGSAPQQPSWNPQLPSSNYSDYSRYGAQPTTSSNPWSSYLSNGGSY